MRTIYAKPNSSEQFIDMRETPVKPDDMILMQTKRPENGDWIAQPDGTWPEKTITPEQQAETERQWAMAELARSDRAPTPDFTTSEADKEKIMAYRARLRNPLRSSHTDYPDPSWRPQWPEGVKRPAV